MRLLKLKNVLQSVALISLSAAATNQVQAQGTSITNFEDATKSSYTAETKTINGMSWYMSGVNIGSDSTRDIKFDTRAARFRHVDTISVELRLESSLEDINAVSFYYARSNFSGDRTGTSPTFVVAVGSGSTWLNLDTIDLAGIDTLTLFSYSGIPAGYDHFKIFTISGTLGKRFNVDSINITYSGTATASLALTYKTPVGSGIPVTTTDLTAKYNSNIEKGTGNIYLYKSTGELVNTFDVTSSAVSITDSTATISGIALTGATSYYVNMDAAVFTKVGSPAITSPELSSSTEWTFTTADTTTFPTMTSLDETFTTCNSGSLLGVFKQYSVLGTKKWSCSSYGRTDSHCVYINGGSAAGVSEENQDWLISKSKFDFSAMSNPALTYWSKKRFEGDVTVTIKISNDYTGSGDPAAATWTDLYTVPSVATDWAQTTGINLSSHKSNPFYLAFVYSCGTTGAYELSLDDIKVASGSTSIFDNEYNNQSLMVLGNATSQNIKLRLSAITAGIYDLKIVDVNGRTVYTQSLNMNAGINDFEIKQSNLQAGFYLINMQNANNGQQATVKAVVK